MNYWILILKWCSLEANWVKGSGSPIHLWNRVGFYLKDWFGLT
jgi:hypothetical protein